MHELLRQSGNAEILRVAFNGVPLLSPLTGIGQYTKALLAAFDKDATMAVNKFYATGWSNLIRNNPMPVNATRLKSVVRRCLPNSYGVARYIQQRSFSQGIKAFSPHVYHEPNFLSFKTETPTVITVHDLSWIRYPDMHPKERVRAMDRYFEPGLKRAAQIITDSEFVRREVIDVFGVKPDKVHAISLGVEPEFRPMSSEETRMVLASLSLEHAGYWLAVGTLEPRKNLNMVIEAFLKMPAAHRRRFPLVVAGMRGWNSTSLELKLRPLIDSGEVRQLGYLSRPDLAVVIAGAKALLYPSVYEGFGLPLLEAMACGVPVVASKVSSIPEVVGNAGVLIDPENVDELSEAMIRLMDDSFFTCQLSDSGLLRSHRFSWERCARETKSIYEVALS